MKITRQKPEDAQTERYLITALIVSEDVCRGLQNQFNQEYFQSKLTKEIAKWCFDFFAEYDDAIKKEIEPLLEMKSKSGKIEPDLEEEIRKFLMDLSEEYSEWETLNAQYYTELGIKYFRKRSFIILSEQLKEAATNNALEEAEQTYSEFVKVSQELSNEREILTAEAVDDLKISLERQPSYLFEMPGDLGKMIGPIERSTFIGILGAEKSGKTYHLMMFAHAAAKRGLNVAMIETGDLTQDQLDLRFYSYLTNKAYKEKNTGSKIVPTLDCLHNQLCDCADCEADTPVVQAVNGKHFYTLDIKDKDILESHPVCIKCYRDRAENRKFKGSVWWIEKEIKQWKWQEVKDRVERFHHRFKGKIVTEAFPMDSIKASDIRNWCIKKQRQEGWTPDVLICDYPDILAPESNKEFRHQENEKWKILRRISQEFHCCVIVATQANSKAYNRESLTLENFSEDKRKFSHVTHFFAINKTAHESRSGCSRLSTLLLREDYIEISNQVTLVQNLNVSNPNVYNFFGRMPRIRGENGNSEEE